jgi:hypothetical protein
MNATMTMIDTAIQRLPAALGPHYAFGYEGNLILKSAVVDLEKREVTLPLYQGRLEDGRTVWHVVTDASDAAAAEEMGLIFSPKLANAGGRAVRSARREADGTFVFDRGAVDFSVERMLIPGNAPDYFPPMMAHAGSVADADYTPLARVGDVVFNATTVAFDEEADAIEFPDGNVDHRLVMDRVTAISPAAGTVTFAMNLGTVASRPIVFISLESNDHFVSAAEATTYTPALSDVSFGKDNEPGSSVAVNYITINGPTGDGNPQAQGVNSALSDGAGQVFDVFKVAPGLRDGYSPMWDLYLGWWTDEAIARGYRARIHSDLEWRTLVKEGWLTGKDGGAMGSVGLVSNCPLIMSW